MLKTFLQAKIPSEGDSGNGSQDVFINQAAKADLVTAVLIKTFSSQYRSTHSTKYKLSCRKENVDDGEGHVSKGEVFKEVAVSRVVIDAVA